MIFLRFGEFIARLRESKGLTQQDLAKQLGKSLAFVQGLERKGKVDDKPKTRPNNLVKLAHILGLSRSELVRQWRLSEIEEITKQGNELGLALEAGVATGSLRRVDDVVLLWFHRQPKMMQEFILQQASASVGNDVAGFGQQSDKNSDVASLEDSAVDALADDAEEHVKVPAHPRQQKKSG
jgi:transcriptional regulator with XRE-family HTH domain